MVCRRCSYRAWRGNGQPCQRDSYVDSTRPSCQRRRSHGFARFGYLYLDGPRSVYLGGRCRCNGGGRNRELDGPGCHTSTWRSHGNRRRCYLYVDGSAGHHPARQCYGEPCKRNLYVDYTRAGDEYRGGDSDGRRCGVYMDGPGPGRFAGRRYSESGELH